MSDDVLERSDALDERIAGTDTIVHLERTARRSRRLIQLLGISIALDVALSIGLGVVAFQANALAQRASSIQTQAHQTCVAGNEGRAGQIQLWDYLLSQPPATPRSPAQQAEADRFRTYVHSLFAPRSC